MKSLLIALLPALLGAACTELSEFDSERVNQELADSLLSVNESWDVTMYIIEDGRRVVSIQTPYAATYQRDDRSETEMEGPVHVTVHDPSTMDTTRVRAGKAIYRGHESVFEFMDDVRVHTQDKRTLRGDHLLWNQSERSISTDQFITIATPTDSIAGYGLQGSDDLSNYTISNVTGQFDVQHP